MLKYHGIIVPLVTPLCLDRQVCEESVDRLIAHVAPTASALMPALSTGEGWQLTLSQWADMVSTTRRHSRGLPVLAGIELPMTKDIIERAGLAARLGVDAIVATAPQIPSLSQEQIFLHFMSILDQTRLPLFIYHEHMLSCSRIAPDTLARLCQVPGIVGIKDSSGEAPQTRQLVLNAEPVPIFQGWEHLCHEVPEVAGYILPLSNLEPQLCAEMLRTPADALLRARIDLLCKQHELLGPEWFRRLKTALKQQGLINHDLCVEPMGAVRP